MAALLDRASPQPPVATGSCQHADSAGRRRPRSQSGGPVGLIKINPKTHPIGHLCKSADVTLDRFATFVIERRNTKSLDVTFARKTQFLLHRNFHRQTVAIPPRFAKDVLAFHSVITRKDVLKNAGFNVVCAGGAIGSRWALVKGPSGGALTGG